MSYQFFIFGLALWMMGWTNVHAASPMNCTKEGKIRHRYNGKMRVEAAKYCVDSSKTRLFSIDCKKCRMEDHDFDFIDLSDLMGTVGSPGFKLCRRVGGQPQIVSFLFNGKWGNPRPLYFFGWILFKYRISLLFI